MNQIKPEKRSFFFGLYVTLAVFSIILFMLNILRFNLPDNVIWIASGAMILIGLLLFINKTYQYKKTVYIFHEDKIIKKSGGMLSNNEIELNIRNITFVKLALPFFRNSLFKTGNISITSTAGGIYLGSLPRPVEFYRYIVSLMKHNGFDVSKKNLIMKEKPLKAGVILDMFSKSKPSSFGAIGTLSFILIALSVALYVQTESFAWLIVGLSVGIILWLVNIVVKYKDYMARTYYLYDSMILYNEGFLDRYESIVPLNNLSDSHVNQDLLSRIFGVYDITISSKGLGSEILFSNMGNGDRLSEELNELIKKNKTLAGSSKKAKAAKGSGSSVASVSKSAAKSVPGFAEDVQDDTDIEYSSDYTTEFKPSVFRAIAPLLPLFLIPPLIPFVAFGLIGIIIGTVTTTYGIKENTVTYLSDFLSKRSKEFTNGKVTGVIVKNNIIDSICKSMSIDFWSIGTSDSISFSGFKQKEVDLDKLLNKFGIYDKESLYALKPNFSFGSMVRSSIFSSIFFGTMIVALIAISAIYPRTAVLWLGIAAVIILLFIIFFAYSKKVSNRTAVDFYDNYLCFRTGWLFKRRYYVLYQNIKNIKTVKYPGIDRGSLEFDVAGSHMQTSGNAQTQISNFFIITHVDGIMKLDELLDLIIRHRRAPKNIAEIAEKISDHKPKTLFVAKQSVGNTVAGMVIGFGLLIAGLIAFRMLSDDFYHRALDIALISSSVIAVLSFSFSLLYVRAKRYVIQDYRVLAISGLVYKKQVSVIVSKIDQISKGQGMFNSIFGNGKVFINTSGSIASEIVVKDSTQFKEFYQMLESRSAEFKDE